MGHADRHRGGVSLDSAEYRSHNHRLCQTKNKFLVLQNCFYGLTLFSRLLIKHLQALVSKSGKKTKARLNLNSERVFQFVGFCLQQCAPSAQGDGHGERAGEP